MSKCKWIRILAAMYAFGAVLSYAIAGWMLLFPNDPAIYDREAGIVGGAMCLSGGVVCTLIARLFFKIRDVPEKKIKQWVNGEDP